MYLSEEQINIAIAVTTLSKILNIVDHYPAGVSSRNFRSDFTHV